MPTFKTAPELESTARSPFDDLNRLERSSADIRAQDRLERVLERNGGNVEREERPAVQEPEPPAAPVAKVAVVPPAPKKQNGSPDPLIEGLFSKLPAPESDWPLAARQKWLQTAANIFDLMYNCDGNAGELAIRVERSNART